MKFYTDHKSYQLEAQVLDFSSDLDLLPTIVKGIFKRESLICAGFASPLSMSNCLSSLPTGVALSTSATTGERTWVFHPWEHFERRCRSHHTSLRQAAFLSYEHAAGIEFIFARLQEQNDFGLFTPQSSPAQALNSLESFSPESLSLTPSTFQRLIAFPALREWILLHIDQIQFGGEGVSQELELRWRESFPNITFSSNFGTTETLSVRTRQHQSLQWHELDDPGVELRSIGGKLLVRSPYLFSHYWNGEEFIPQTHEWWETGDEVEFRSDGAFKLTRSIHRKFHGVKVYPADWERDLENEFNLSWVQFIQQDDQSFLGIIDEQHSALIDSIKSFSIKKSWPVVKWISVSSPEITQRGKKKL